LEGLYYPDLSEEALFSVGRFDEQGFGSVFANQRYYLFPNDLIQRFVDQSIKHSLIQGEQRSDGLYWISTNTLESADAPSKSFLMHRPRRTSKQWHKALNHISYVRLKQASKLVTGLELLDEPDVSLRHCDCPACFMGKSKELPYPHNSSRALKACGDLISMDGWGPINDIPDWHGNRYYIVFLDHFSGKSFLHLYQSPGDVTQIIIDVLTEMETFLGHPIKTLRSDKESSYTSSYVQDYCKSKGVRLEYSLTGASQQMGSVENFHLHSLAAIRTMLTQAQLGHDLWGEAALNYNYTRNKLPTAGRDHVPDQIWYNTHMDISHLHAFGEQCFAHVFEKDQLSKVTPRAFTAYFLGYDLHTKAYRLLDPATRSLVLCRSVEFYSDFTWPDPTQISRFGEFELPDPSPASEYIPSDCSDDDSDRASVTEEPQARELGNDTESTPAHTISSPDADTTELPAVTEYSDDDSYYSTSSTDSPVPASSTLPVPSAVQAAETTHPMVTRSKTRAGTRALLSTSPVSLVLEPPSSYFDIKHRSDAEEWYAAAQRELQGLYSKQVATVVPRPLHTKVIKNRYVFTRKASGEAKARIVLKDFVKQGESSSYAPVAEDASFKLLCAISASLDLDMYQYDVTQAFLNASFEEDVYTEIPTGWLIPRHLDPTGDYVLLLHKALYGHRKAPALWNKEIDGTLVSLGFTSSPGDACLYAHSSHPLFLILHVDDFIIAGNQSSLRDDIIASLSVKYGIKCLGEVTRFTNYQVSRDRSKREIYLYQRDYIAEILTLSGMQDCYGTKTKGSLFTSGLSPSLSTADIVEQEGNIAYRQLTGGLIHLSSHSRPDISYEAASLSKHNTAPTAQHTQAITQVSQVYC